MSNWLNRIDPWLREPKAEQSTVLYVAASLPWLGVMWALQHHALTTDSVRALYHEPTLGLAQTALSALTVWLLALALLAWFTRHAPTPAQQWLGHGCVLPTVLVLTLLWAGYGLRDTPIGLAVVETLIAGRALFGWGPVWPGMVLGATMLLICEVMQGSGALGLTPMLQSPVFTGGNLQDWWAVWLRLVYGFTAWPFLAAIVYLFASLQRHRMDLESLVSTDMLTGLYNRREWMNRLALESHRHLRAGLPLSVVMIDVDHFKKVNDTHGHQAGDVVLARLGDLIRQNLRQHIDLGARMGGEEFALLLPETDLAGAQTVALKLRDAVRQTPFEHEGHPFTVTLSAGVAEVEGGEGSQALRIADERLYRAKKLGRDRVVTVMR
jgi:diguanylate cyclase (GGDEF)-like protein